MAAVGDFLLQRQLHELLGWRTHILKALTEGDDRKAHALKILYHLDSAPAVEGNLADVVALAKALDELLDKAVVDDITVRGKKVALLLPQIIRDVVSPDADVQRILRQP